MTDERDIRRIFTDHGATSIDAGDWYYLMYIIGKADKLAPQDKHSRKAIDDFGKKYLEFIRAFKNVEEIAKEPTKKNGRVNVCHEFIENLSDDRELFADAMSRISTAFNHAVDTGFIATNKGAPPKNAWNTYVSAMIAACRLNPIGPTKFIDLLHACQFLLPKTEQVAERQQTVEKLKEFRNRHIDDFSSDGAPLSEWLDNIYTQHIRPEGE